MEHEQDIVLRMSPAALYGSYSVALLVIVLDQISKWWVQGHFELYERVAILPVFDFTLVYNEGAAWSFLSDAGGWQRWMFAAISAVVSVVITVWIARLDRRQWYLRIGLILILGGAVGNLIDRLLLGKVVDFILVYYNESYFPAFNLADSAITLGAGFLILDMFFPLKVKVDDK